MGRLWALVLVLIASPLSAQTVEAGGGAFAASDTKSCRTDLVYLNQLFGWQARWPRQWTALASADDNDLKAGIEQWKAAPAALSADQDGLAKASGTSSAAPKVVVDHVADQVEALRRDLERGAPPLSKTASPVLRAQWNGLFADKIVPALRRFETFLRTDYRPWDGAPGLAHTPSGAQCFAELVQAFTTADDSPEAIERQGWSLINRTNREIAALNGIPVSQLPELLNRLRQPKTGFSRSDLVAKSEAAVMRAKAAMPRLFDQPLRQDLQIEPLSAAMESTFPAGFYQSAPAGQPARVVLNLSRPEDRALMAEVIAFHEGLPGHHVPSGLGYPAGEFNSGMGEGWALYAEYLADEAGLYGGKEDRTGMMAKHLWAASRLIVEPGLHVHGWSRQQAIDFMRRHTALSDGEIALEVDRYIATPGQSLSYMLGYQKIMAARHYAEKALGRRFDIRRFHDIVLGKGYRPLDEMYNDVVAWAGKEAASLTPRK